VNNKLQQHLAPLCAKEKKASRFTISDLKSMLVLVHHHKKHELLALSANPTAFAHYTLLKQHKFVLC